MALLPHDSSRSYGELVEMFKQTMAHETATEETPAAFPEPTTTPSNYSECGKHRPSRTRRATFATTPSLSLQRGVLPGRRA